MAKEKKINQKIEKERENWKRIGYTPLVEQSDYTLAKIASSPNKINLRVVSSEKRKVTNTFLMLTREELESAVAMLGGKVEW